MALETFGTGQGFLKAGFFGFPKSGKTWTAMLLALELWRRIGKKKPIAFLDSEGGAEYLAKNIYKATGIYPVGAKSRSLADTLKVGRECEQGAADIYIVDSITHVWREACNAYLDQVNRARDAQNKPKRQRLEFQDWAAIKEKWNVWTDFFLNSQLHIIISGRAGYEWDFQEAEDGRKELVKTGVKMKVESEFGFEPSLLVEMERVQVPDQDSPDHFRLMHRARVLGDRFDAMDGAISDNPTGQWFAAHLDMLTPGAANIVDVSLKTDMGVDEEGQARSDAYRRSRTIVLEKIEGEIGGAYPGQTKEEKRQKIEILEACFGSKSWEEIKTFSPKRLGIGLEAVKSYIEQRKPQEANA